MALEQMMGSLSFGSTFATQFSLKGYNYLGLALLLIWILSPLAGQSSFRLLLVEQVQKVSHPNIPYMNVIANPDFLFTAQVSLGALSKPTAFSVPTLLNSLYGASLFAPKATKVSPLDIWGNVKIPDILHNGQAADGYGWINVTGPNTTYASLLGIPIEKVPTQGNTTFSIETSYIAITCPEVLTTSQIKVIEPLDLNTANELVGKQNDFLGPRLAETDAQSPYDYTFALATDFFLGPIWSPNASVNVWSITQAPPAFRFPQGQGTLLVQSRNLLNYVGNSTYTTAQCPLSTAYVESNVTCVSTNCIVTAVRPSKRQYPSANMTNLMFGNLFFQFSSSLIEALPQANNAWSGADHANSSPDTLGSSVYASSSPTQMYLQDPFFSNDFGLTQYGYANLTEVTPSELSIRLEQVINSYWQASMLKFLTLQVNDSGLPDLNSSLNFFFTEGENFTWQDYYRCDWLWLMVNLLATAIMLAAAIAGIWLAWRVQGPEVLGYCSSLIKDSRYIQNSRKSTLTAPDRTKKLGTLRLRLADVQGDQEVGRVAIVKAEDVDDETIIPLRKEREYR